MHHWPVLCFTAALVVKQAFTDLITETGILGRKKLLTFIFFLACCSTLFSHEETEELIQEVLTIASRGAVCLNLRRLLLLTAGRFPLVEGRSVYLYLCLHHGKPHSRVGAHDTTRLDKRRIASMFCNLTDNSIRWVIVFFFFYTCIYTLKCTN